MDIKQLLITALFVLVILPVSAVELEETYNLFTEQCYGNITLKIRGSLEITNGEYDFPNCIQTNESFWSCECYNTTSVVFKTFNQTKNEYDIVLQYYLYPEINDNSMRVLNFNNVDITKTRRAKRLELPDGAKMLGVIVIVVILIILFILAIVAGLRMILIDEDEKNDKKAQKRWKEQEALKELEDEVRKNM